MRTCSLLFTFPRGLLGFSRYKFGFSLVLSMIMIDLSENIMEHVRDDQKCTTECKQKTHFYRCYI